MLWSPICALRINLPVSVVTVWVSNPFTIPPLSYFCYKVGTWLLGLEPVPMEFEFSIHWFTQQLVVIWQPFLLGSLILGALSAALGYVLARLFWRLAVLYLWRLRRQKKLETERSQS